MRPVRQTGSKASEMDKTHLPDRGQKLLLRAKSHINKEMRNELLGTGKIASSSFTRVILYAKAYPLHKPCTPKEKQTSTMSEVCLHFAKLGLYFCV